MKKYKFGFDYFALLLFIIMMIPTIFWSFVKAPEDVLRVESVTPVIDIIASISQVIVIASLCILKKDGTNKPHFTKAVFAAIICILVYYFAWVMYYCAIVNPVIIILLTIPPCVAFLLYSIDRKNIIATVSGILFLICHFVFGLVNFII